VNTPYLPVPAERGVGSRIRFPGGNGLATLHRVDDAKDGLSWDGGQHCS